MKNLNKREKYLLVVMAIGIVGYIYLNYFLFPILDNIKNTNTNIDTYNNQINQLRIISITNSKLGKELEGVKAKYSSSLAMLPDFERNPEIAYNIKSLANSNNVTLNSISLGEPAVYSGDNANKPSKSEMTFYKVTVSLSLSADNYFDLMGFVNSLENDKRLATVDILSIQRNKISASPIMIQGDNKVSNSNEKTNLQSNITVNYLFTLNSTNKKPQYDFNKGTYGKDDLFR